MSKVVSVVCGNCEDHHTNGHVEATFAIEYDAEDIADAQQHMDRMFVARCGTCFGCAWEVVAVNDTDKVAMLDLGR